MHRRRFKAYGRGLHALRSTLGRPAAAQSHQPGHADWGSWRCSKQQGRAHVGRGDRFMSPTKASAATPQNFHYQLNAGLLRALRWNATARTSCAAMRLNQMQPQCGRCTCNWFFNRGGVQVAQERTCDPPDLPPGAAPRRGTPVRGVHGLLASWPLCESTSSRRPRA